MYMSEKSVIVKIMINTHTHTHTYIYTILIVYIAWWIYKQNLHIEKGRELQIFSINIFPKHQLRLRLSPAAGAEKLRQSDAGHPRLDEPDAAVVGDHLQPGASAAVTSPDAAAQGGQVRQSPAERLLDPAGVEPSGVPLPRRGVVEEDVQAASEGAGVARKHPPGQSRRVGKLRRRNAQ